MRTATRLALAALPLLAACHDDQDLKNDVGRLEIEARAFLHAECASASDCTAAAVGAKPCGGPQYYWVYCRTTSDEPALLAKLEQARLLEQRYNELTDARSDALARRDCALVVPPATYSIVDGKCHIESCGTARAMMSLPAPECTVAPR